jgi:regulating synaptic membrane exocytosis protein 2
VKLYIFDGRCCIEKLKTSVARRTLEPMYQEVLRFQQSHRDKILQVTIWGDYGKLDRKVFMGVAQIMLNELDLTSMVIGWYKLYSVSSLMSDYALLLSKSSTTSTKNLTSTGSGFSFDSDNTAQTLK